MNLKLENNTPPIVPTPSQPHIANDYTYQKMYESERDKVIDLRMQIVQLQNEKKLGEIEHKHNVEKILQQQDTDQKLGAIAEAGSLANQMKDFLPMIGEVLPMIQGLSGPKYSPDIMNFITWFENRTPDEKILFGQILVKLNADNNFLMNAQALLANE